MKRLNEILRSRCGLALALLFVFPLRVGAQPAGQDTLPLQATATRTLLNGLRIEILATPHFPRVAIHLLIGVGTTLDPAGKAGLAELAAALLLESVQDWQGDPAEIGKIIDAGRTFHYEVNWDSTHFFTECAPQELETCLEALSRLVKNPLMTEQRFAAVRDQASARLGGQAAVTTESDLAGTVFDSELFQGNPYARPGSGTPHSLKNIIYGDLVLFQRRVYLPNVSSLAIVGPVQADQVKTLAGRTMGIWVMEEQFLFTFLPPKGQSGLTLLALDWPQAGEPVLVVGHLGITRDSRDYVALRLLAGIAYNHLNQLLLPPSTPEMPFSWKLKLEAESRRMKGAIRVVLQKKDLEVDGALRQMRQALVSLRQTNPTTEETSAAVRQFLAAMQSRARTAPGLARMLAEAGTYQLGFNYYERLKQELPLLTPEELGRAAQRIFDPDNLLAVFVGPVAGQNLDGLKADGWQLRIVPAAGEK